MTFHIGSTKHFKQHDPAVSEKIPLHVEAVEQVPDSDVLILDFVIIGRDRSIWHGGHDKDEPCDLYALFAEWENNIAYCLRWAVISETDWISFTNQKWRLVTLG